MPALFPSAQASSRAARDLSPERTTVPDAERVCPGAPRRRTHRQPPVLTPEQLDHIQQVNNVFWGQVYAQNVNQ